MPDTCIQEVKAKAFEVTQDQLAEDVQQIFEWINENFPDLSCVIKWNVEVDYSLLMRIIQFNIDEKENCKTFFRN